jgi:hypothetical protein
VQHSLPTMSGYLKSIWPSYMIFASILHCMRLYRSVETTCQLRMLPHSHIRRLAPGDSHSA